MLGSLISWAVQTTHEKKKPFCEHLPVIGAGAAHGSAMLVLILIITMSCSGLLTAAEPGLEMTPHKSQYTVGESWVITATGPPNTPITVTVTYNFQSQGTSTFGYIDSSGNFRFDGTVLSDQVGHWTEEWFIGGISVNWFEFDVVPVPVPCTFQLSSAGVAMAALTYWEWRGGQFGYYALIGSGAGGISATLTYPSSANCTIQSISRTVNRPDISMSTSTSPSGSNTITTFNFIGTPYIAGGPGGYPVSVSDTFVITGKDTHTGQTTVRELRVDLTTVAVVW